MFICIVFSLKLSAKLLFCSLVYLNKQKLERTGHHVIKYHNYHIFKNIFNKKIEIQVLNVRGDVYAE